MPPSTLPSSPSLDATLPADAGMAAGASLTSDTPGGNAQAGGRAYLLVFDGRTSSFFPVPRDGEALIGRGENAALRLDEPSVSRLHARLVCAGGETTLVDLQSQNGTRVNGERLAHARALVSGDVVSLGSVTLVFHRDPRPPPRKPLLELVEFRLRLDEEIERSRRYRSPATVLSLEIGPQAERGRVSGQLSASLRLLDTAAWAGETQVLLLLPEVSAEQAQLAARRLLSLLVPMAPNAHAGYATCPDDGCDADGLIAGARTAAQTAPAGGSKAASEAATALRVGDKTIVAAAPAMTRLFALMERLAPSDLPVLIVGETGVGKDIAASALHAWSSRRGPLVAINCAALPESLLESELFGFEKGAFSGAVAAKPGLLESAGGGTLFLDEIGELSATAQAKLLRVVETRRAMRLGSVRDQAVDVRLVAATNRSLLDEVRAGRFRQDLYYRLSAATVSVPPLRDRLQELPILARGFLQAACERLGRAPMTLAAETLRELITYRWPGNIRELKNTLEYAAAAWPVDELLPEHLPPGIRQGYSDHETPRPPVKSEDLLQGLGPLRAVEPEPGPELAREEGALALQDAGSSSGAASPPAPEGGFRNLYEEIRSLERTRILQALEAAGGVQIRAAELIGMPLRTFVTRLRQLGIAPGRRGA